MSDTAADKYYKGNVRPNAGDEPFHWSPVPGENVYHRTTADDMYELDVSDETLGTRGKLRNQAEKYIPPKYWIENISPRWNLTDIAEWAEAIDGYVQEVIERLHEAQHIEVTGAIAKYLELMDKILVDVERIRAGDIIPPRALTNLTEDRLLYLKDRYCRNTQVALTQWNLVATMTDGQKMVSEEGRVRDWIKELAALIKALMNTLMRWAQIIEAERMTMGEAATEEQAILKRIENRRRPDIVEGSVIEYGEEV